MNENEQNGQDRVRALMMAALDDELSADEQRELDRALGADASLRGEWDRMRSVKEVTQNMNYIKPPDGVWEDYWTSAYNRVERGFGWILLSVGALVLAAWVIFDVVDRMLADTTLPASIKLAIAALAIGGLVLLVSVAREKFVARRTDPYKGVQR